MTWNTPMRLNRLLALFLALTIGAAPARAAITHKEPNIFSFTAGVASSSSSTGTVVITGSGGLAVGGAVNIAGETYIGGDVGVGTTDANLGNVGGRWLTITGTSSSAPGFIELATPTATTQSGNDAGGVNFFNGTIHAGEWNVTNSSGGTSDDYFARFRLGKGNGVNHHIYDYLHLGGAGGSNTSAVKTGFSASGLGGTVAYMFDVLGVDNTNDTTGETLGASFGSNITSLFASFRSKPYSQATTFTTSHLRHFYQDQAILGTGHTVNNEIAFWVDGKASGGTVDRFAAMADSTSFTGDHVFFFTSTNPSEFAGVIRAGDGGVGAPGFAFTSDPDNGAYRIGANNWALSVGGSKVLEFSTGGIIAVNDLYVSSTSQSSSVSTGAINTAGGLGVTKDTFIGGSVNVATLTASQAVVTNGSKTLASLAYASANTASALVQRDGSGNFSAGTITAALTGNASTATTATTATNATNVATTGVTNNATYYPVFVSSTSDGNQAIKLDSGGTQLTYNPSTGVLTTTASNSQTVGVGTSSVNSSYRIPFATAASATASLNSNTNLVFNPSTGALTTTTVVAALTGEASGNTKYTANNHGVVVSGSANTMTVIAPDASTTKVLVSGGASADPAWGTVAAGAMPALTGDVTSSAGAVATTAAATQANITTLSAAAGVAVHGTNTNDSAAAGYVGEELTATANGLTITNGNAINITSLAITAGHWRVSGSVCFLNSGMTASMAIGAIGTTNTSLGSNYTGTKTAVYPIQNNDTCIPVGPFPLKLSGTTTYYLNFREDFSGGSGTAGGTIYAIRVR